MLKSKLSSESNFTISKIFDLATYIGFLIFILSLPFDNLTVFLNIGMSFVLFGWVGQTILERKLNWHRTPLDIPIVLFLGLALVACLFTPHFATSSLGYFWKLLRAILLFYAVIHSRLGIRWRHVLIAFFVAAWISSSLGIWYYANGTGLALSLMGRVDLAYQNELSTGEGFSDELRGELRQINIPLSQSASISPSKKNDKWRIDDLERNRRYVVHKGETQLMVYMIEQRLAGTFKAPNYLGAYLALSLPFVIGYFVASWQSLRKKKNGILIIFVLGVLVAMMTVNLVLTLTRGAWVGVVFATVCIGIYLVVSGLSKLKSINSLLKRVLIGGTLIVMISGAFVFLMPQHIKTRFNTMVERPTGFMGERPQWWRVSLDLIQKYPITGIGLGRFRHEAQLNAPPDLSDVPFHAHNIYLHISVEQGLPSLFLFLWMIGLIWKRIWAIRSRKDIEGLFWNMGAFIGGSGFLISVLVYGIADYIFHHRSLLLFWFIIGIIYYIQIHKDEKHEEKLETG
ncbi:MAG: O-antigen ligase family protein [Candidatus Poribacteria bacterium]|nr:O-antigen ligase family protein [Candidatus Poribacteria bacterium]